MRIIFIMIIPIFLSGVFTFLALIFELIKSIWLWSLEDLIDNMSDRCDDIAEGIRYIFKGITNIDLNDN